jgi:NADPH:quinone reductase-like Zn-dependent oxidoreductase
MHAAVITEYGQAPQYRDFPDPALENGEVLVRVRASGLHPLVKALARGTHYATGGDLPAVAGVDGVGVLPDGQRVYFVFVRKPWGPMAELAPVQSSLCVAVPEGLGDVDAAAIANPGMSAWMSLKRRAELMAGETVVILGATGVAGQIAIQMARLIGARRVVGVGRNVEALASAGVDRVISLSDSEGAVLDAFAEEAAAGIDVVLDYLWSRPAELLLDALAKQFNRKGTHRTRWVQVGESAGKTINLAAGTLRSVDVRLVGSGFGANPMDEILASIQDLFRMAAEGKLKVSSVAVPLEQVEAAWGSEEKGQRIVFTV